MAEHKINFQRSSSLDSIRANNSIGAITFADKKDALGINQDLVSRSRKYERERVRRFLANPLTNIAQLQEISRYLMTTSGNYFRIIEYLTGMMTLDHVISPSMQDVDSIDESVLDEFLELAHKLKGMKLKRNFRWILKELLVNGEVYLYEVEQGDEVMYAQIPNQWCRVSAIENGVFRYDILASALREEDVAHLPQEFQGLVGKDTKDTDGWVRVSEAGFCFNILGAFPKGYPYLAFMFDDIMGLEDIKDLIENKTKLDTVKLIHQEIPLNSKDVPVFSMDIARMYHEATKRNLPEGVAITTNPLKMSHVPFEKSAHSEVDAIERSERNMWNSAGISDLLFSNNKTGGEIMKLSVIADEMLMIPFLRIFEDYVNYKLDSENFKFSFLDITYFNRESRIRAYKESIELGAGRLHYLGMLGYEPHEIISTLTFEQKVMNIDELMIPKKTSHTLSGDSGEPGRPSNEETGNPNSDNTDKAKEME